MTCLEAGEVHDVRGCERVSRERIGKKGTKCRRNEMDGWDGCTALLAGTLMGYVTAADCDRTDTARRGEKWRVLIYANPCSHQHHHARERRCIAHLAFPMNCGASITEEADIS